MNDKNKQQLRGELAESRQRVAELEKALQATEMKAAILLQAAPLGIHVCDAEGRITYVNPRQERITGYSSEELVGTYIWDRMEPGPAKDALPAYLKHLVLEQPIPTPFVAKNIQKNGERYEIRVDWNYERNPQGQVTAFVCIITDVTEQKRAEDALATNKAVLEATIESLPFDFWAIGPDGRYMIQNFGQQNALGRRHREASRRRCQNAGEPLGMDGKQSARFCR